MRFMVDVDARSVLTIVVVVVVVLNILAIPEKILDKWVKSSGKIVPRSAQEEN